MDNEEERTFRIRFRGYSTAIRYYVRKLSYAIAER